MKKIFTNSELVHKFAEQSQEQGQTTTRNMFFNKNKIYSYGHHYLLAEILPNNIILINDTGYSSSTGKHIAKLRQATRQYKQYFFYDICLNNVHERIIEASKKIINARKKEIYANEIINSFENFNEYLNQFKECIYKKNETIEKSKILKTDEYKEIKKIYKSIFKDKEKYIEEGKERVKKELLKADEKFKIDLEKFFNYELNYITSTKKIDFLRISQDKKQIETTQNVKIDLDEAKKLYELIEKGIEIKGLKISNYTIISLNGLLKIGCHNIDIDNMHTIGKQIKTL